MRGETARNERNEGNILENWEGTKWKIEKVGWMKFCVWNIIESFEESLKFESKLTGLNESTSYRSSIKNSI